MKLIWTKENPSVDGYYWLRLTNEFSGQEFPLVLATILDDHMYLYGVTGSVPMPTSGAYWAGPVSIPMRCDENCNNEKVVVTEEKLHAVACRIIKKVMKKNHDYGDAWQKHSFSWVVRIVDKLCRVETLADGKKALILDEVIEDTLIDAIGYSLLGLLYLDDVG